MIPEKIGRYEIIDELGRGGMATVYRAQDPRFKRDVAIKLMPEQFLAEKNFRARFEREAQTIAAIEHPAIVPVYDFGEDNGRPYLVMRYMPGGSLADKLEKGPISPEEASHIIARLASALDQVHQRHIVHRDLKPANVLFDQYNEAYLSDFGIARLNEATTSLTGEAIVGTPAYMSPEQARGETDIDGRSDLYALGVMLFQMLTGKQPYEAPTPIAVAMKHITDPIPRLTETRPDLSLSYERVIDGAMAKDRDKRFATGSDLFTALEKAMLEAEGSLRAPHGEQSRDSFDTAIQINPAESDAISDAVSRPPSSPSGKPTTAPLPYQRPVTPAPAPGSQPAMSKPRRGVPMWAWIVIGVLSIGLICGILFIAFAIFAESTANPEPTQTMAVRANTQPTDTQSIETPVSDNIPATETPIALTSGDIIFNDDFTDAQSGWPVIDDTYGIADYDPDNYAYNIYVANPNDRIEALPGLKLADADIEVSTYKEDGPDDNLFGLMCRYQNRNNFYLFAISSDGYYTVGKVVNGTYELQNGRPMPSDVINTGEDENLLEAECSGDEMSFFVNGTELARFNDTTFEEGDIGVFVGTYNESGAEISFQDFIVYVP